MENFKKVAVLGGGSFGTVLANLAASNDYKVSLWVRDAEQALRINSEGANTSYHPELKLSDNIQATEDLNEVMRDASIIFIATPSIIFEQIMSRISELIDNNAYVISCTKGILENPFRSMTDVIQNKIKNDVGVLSGPNLAKEIAQNKIAGTVIASNNQDLIKLVKNTLSSKTFKIFSSNDIQGVELGGALKNIYAIGAGLCDGLNLGDNAKSSYITRALNEMVSIGRSLGGRKETFYGLSGFGDLIATCFGDWSRNRKFGESLAKGVESNSIIQGQKTVVEGFVAVHCLYQIARRNNLETPILDELHSIIYDNKAPLLALNSLMERHLKTEF